MVPIGRPGGALVARAGKHSVRQRYVTRASRCKVISALLNYRHLVIAGLDVEMRSETAKKQGFRLEGFGHVRSRITPRGKNPLRPGFNGFQNEENIFGRRRVQLNPSPSGNRAAIKTRAVEHATACPGMVAGRLPARR